MFIWIWQLDNLVSKYGSIDKLITKLKSLNIKDVCIKFHEGASYTGGGINYRDAFIKYKANFKNAGVKVGTWGYNYFNDTYTEGRIIIDALDNSDYYIFDPEVDISNKFTASETVCKSVRAAHPNAVLGYSSFPIVSSHLDIPYAVFDKYCNFASPQAYWGEMQWDINKCIDKMLSDHKYYGLNLPIYPSIQTYNVSSASYAAYTKYGFNRSGAWSLDEMDSTFESFVCLYRDSSTTLQSTSATTSSTTSTAKISDAIKALQYDLNIDYNAKLTLIGIADNATIAALKGIQSIIVKGHKSSVVKWIQQKLIGYGYLAKGKDSGIYDEATFQAVTNMQKNWGRTTSGILNIETWQIFLNN
jgi:Putative peptidoglycan-binding domain-containing protein